MDPTPTPQTRLSRLRQHFQQDISRSWADAVLILCCFLAGLVDSAVFNVWGCFSSMQTGNTVYVGLGLSSQPPGSPYRWAKSLTAILSFSTGALLISRTSRFLSPLRRSTVCISFLFQASLCLAAATLVHLGVVPANAGDLLPGNAIVLLPLGMLAFQSAGQIVMSRMLAYKDVPTVVLTSTYCDLMSDPYLFQGLRENSARNRRVGSVVALVVGAMAGGALTRGGEIEGVLWVAGGLKVGVVVVWVVWRGEGAVRLE